MAIDYKAWLEGAKAGLVDLQGRKESLQAQQAELARQEREIDKQIHAMAQIISGLAPLMPEEPPEPSVIGLLAAVGKALVDVGLTGRIRTILQVAAPRELSAIEIRSELQSAGFYLGDYANALATIYTTLGRMVASNEIIETSSPEGRRFRWNTSLQRALTSVLSEPADMPRGLKGRVGTYRPSRLSGRIQRGSKTPQLAPPASSDPTR